MNDRAATGGIDHRRILLDPVERFHLGAPTVRPGRDADILAREQRRDLVGFVGVVKAANPETELGGNVEEPRHFIGAMEWILTAILSFRPPSSVFHPNSGVRGKEWVGRGKSRWRPTN